MKVYTLQVSVPDDATMVTTKLALLNAANRVNELPSLPLVDEQTELESDDGITADLFRVE